MPKKAKEELIPYYTNSTQLPVGYTDDMIEAIKLQEVLQTKYTGGTVFHGLLGERISGKQARLLVKKILSKSQMPYFSVSPTFSICPKHGYIKGEHLKCPEDKCEKECEVYARVVGYIRPVQQWNKGKVQEYSDRKEFLLESVLNN